MQNRTKRNIFSVEAVSIRAAVLVALIACIAACVAGCSSSVGQQENSQASESESREQGEEKYSVAHERISASGDSKFSADVEKNELAKTAEVKATYRFTDAEESKIQNGAVVYTAPLSINVMCWLFPAIMIRPDSLEVTEESRANFELFMQKLEGYTVTSVSILFLDDESDQKIASCQTTNLQDLSFDVFRTYPVEQSAFGAQIGVLDREQTI